MADTPEGAVKRWLYGDKKKPGRLFHYFPGAYVYKPPGGMFGRNGTPDCFLVWRGVFIAIEVKAEDGDPMALQLKSLRAIAAAGGVAALIRGKDEDRLRAIHQEVMARVQRYESSCSVQ
jgi:hypothetical protein